MPSGMEGFKVAEKVLKALKHEIQGKIELVLYPSECHSTHSGPCEAKRANQKPRFAPKKG
jgi:hypothetical protein